MTSSFSTLHWWTAAVLSGAALAAAAQFLATTTKGRMLTALLPLVGAVAVILNSAARGYEGETPLVLYTATALGLTLCRIVFSKYLRRQRELVLSGKPMEQATGKQTALFLLTFAVIVLGLAILL
ncbi:hypothetical protein ACFY9Q_01930 [Streptomyces sp. NPDC012389]|uniref:hypothetical protein n=1 Tax=Streptomyces sp. NPDC012389 TaxID=3364830 RepID=UPI0036E244BA